MCADAKAVMGLCVGEDTLDPGTCEGTIRLWQRLARASRLRHWADQMCRGERRATTVYVCKGAKVVEDDVVEICDED